MFSLTPTELRSTSTENVFYVLKNAMRKSILPHQYRSWSPMRRTISWNSMSNVSIQSLYKSLPRRRQQVLKMKRHITRYWSDCPYTEVRTFKKQTKTLSAATTQCCRSGESLLSLECPKCKLTLVIYLDVTLFVFKSSKTKFRRPTFARLISKANWLSKL